MAISYTRATLNVKQNYCHGLLTYKIWYKGEYSALKIFSVLFHKNCGLSMQGFTAETNKNQIEVL